MASTRCNQSSPYWGDTANRNSNLRRGTKNQKLLMGSPFPHAPVKFALSFPTKFRNDRKITIKHKIMGESWYFWNFSRLLNWSLGSWYFKFSILSLYILCPWHELQYDDACFTKGYKTSHTKVYTKCIMQCISDRQTIRSCVQTHKKSCEAWLFVS